MTVPTSNTDVNRLTLISAVSRWTRTSQKWAPKLWNAYGLSWAGSVAPIASSAGVPIARSSSSKPIDLRPEWRRPCR